MIFREGDNGYFYAGRDYLSNHPFCVAVALGRRDDAKEGELKFRHSFRWVPRWPLRIWRSGRKWFVEIGFGTRRYIHELN